MENSYSSMTSLQYDIIIVVALGVKWISEVVFKTLKVVGLQLGDVAIPDISAAPIGQDELTTQSIRSDESGFQFDPGDDDKALPAAFLNSIAENFAKTPTEILHGQGFSRLLFATGIVMDNTNLSSPYRTSRDNDVTTLLIDGAGRIEFNGTYRIPSLPTHGLQDRKVGEILQKYFKKWAMSDQPIPIWSWLRPNIRMLVAHLHNSASIKEILLCLVKEKLRMLTVIFGYYNSQKRFKRDILVSTKSFKIMKNLPLFLHSSEVELQLRALIQSGLQGARRVFVINKVASRRTILCLLASWFPP